MEVAGANVVGRIREIIPPPPVGALRRKCGRCPRHAARRCFKIAVKTHPAYTLKALKGVPIQMHTLPDTVTPKAWPPLRQS